MEIIKSVPGSSKCVKFVPFYHKNLSKGRPFSKASPVLLRVLRCFPNAPWDWNIYLRLSYKSMAHVGIGKYSIHDMDPSWLWKKKAKIFQLHEMILTRLPRSWESPDFWEPTCHLKNPRWAPDDRYKYGVFQPRNKWAEKSMGFTGIITPPFKITARRKKPLVPPSFGSNMPFHSLIWNHHPG